MPAPGNFGPPRQGGPGGPGGPPGFGGPPQERKLLKQFDANKDKKLDKAERKAALEFLSREQAEGRGMPRRGPGGPGRGAGGPRPEDSAPPQAGEKVAASDVKPSNAPLYDAATLRTFFLEFDSPDWEKELMEFNNTDVEIPARLTVDGKTYEDVGVHFRGASSFFTVSEGRKHSLNISTDFIKEDQNVGGYRTLNLLNSHTDPSFLRTFLYYYVAHQYIPTPKANHVRLVINGESWGVYVNAQQFNKEFIKEAFGSTKGARWKVPGSPRGRGGLEYLGDNPGEYKTIYEIKSKDDPKAWQDLVNLCKILNQTPTNELQKAIEPILDVDGALKFLALENVLMNADGYWIRASDYNIYQDEKGKFHIVPHDANETFRPAGGGPPGMRGGGGGGGGGGEPRNPMELSVWAGSQDANKPLLNKLLSVPAYRERYLANIRHIAENWLDWNKVGPIAEKQHNRIAAEVKKDTRKLYQNDAFEKSLAASAQPQPEPGMRGPGAANMSLKQFCDARRAYLLSLPEVKNAPVMKMSN